MNPTKITRRLANSSKPEGLTYQEKLTPEDISKKLLDYVKVQPNEIFKIPLNTHLRYISINSKTGEKSFRLGGFLTKFGDNNEYIVLTNNNVSWSVQLATSIIFKKLSPNELIHKVETEVHDEVKKRMDQLEKENKDLKKIIKQIKVTTENSKSKKK